MFGKKKEAGGSTYEYLIAGLGNPGAKYETTRHNAGFLCVTMLEDKYNFKAKKLKFHALIGDTYIGTHRCIVMKPQTMMNNSGEAIKECAAFYKIPPENIVVIFDDISLEPGRIRIRRKGSAGGHNGIKSIIAHLGSENFPRIKLGVGAKPSQDSDLADWVLGNFPKADVPKMRDAIGKACDALPLILDGDIDGAMSKYNS
ncbi:MAG: aminoacyl-tRNA hydrolase [Oscillospiraceae bacterium]|nr:aminoacyl-tRNA hydrolase [Oscillospiraceae bacterium]MDD7470464.1 aminoacyl-tRNA hydrolase [Oscillospiraceae bacterium]MDY2678792.1 aminoacyl-tRNA hydrolase [Oscillospiraceae bacterium]